jgi:hypothetical protein
VQAHSHTSRAVSLVAYDRVTQPSQVGPYLMLAAGFQFYP